MVDDFNLKYYCKPKTVVYTLMIDEKWVLSHQLLTNYQQTQRNG